MRLTLSTSNRGNVQHGSAAPAPAAPTGGSGLGPGLLLSLVAWAGIAFALFRIF